MTVLVTDRGRDAHCWAPPAQNRTCGFPAYGSHLGCVTVLHAVSCCIAVRAPAPVTHVPGSVPGACFAGSRSPRPLPFAPPTPSPGSRLRSQASTLLRQGLSSRAPSRRGPDGRASVLSDTRPPRFRQVPFVRDEVFDPDRATAPRMTVPHMLPSAGWTASASVALSLSWLNSSPRTIAVYASWPPSPTELTQHSLPGGCYPLPGPDFHRLEPASFPGAPIHDFGCGTKESRGWPAPRPSPGAGDDTVAADPGIREAIPTGGNLDSLNRPHRPSPSWPDLNLAIRAPTIGGGGPVQDHKRTGR